MQLVAEPSIPVVGVHLLLPLVPEAVGCLHRRPYHSCTPARTPVAVRSKRQLLEHLQTTRQRLQRLHVCAQWAHKAKAVNTCREVLKAAQDHGAAFVHTGGCYLLPGNLLIYVAHVPKLDVSST